MRRLGLRLGSLLFCSVFLFYSFAANAGVFAALMTANGESRQHLKRQFSVPLSGMYLLKVRNGDGESNPSSLIDLLNLKINDIEMDSSLLRRGSFQVFDIALTAGANLIEIEYSGPARAQIDFEIGKKDISVSPGNLGLFVDRTKLTVFEDAVFEVLGDQSNSKAIYSWDFGDGSEKQEITSSRVHHRFAKDGVYKVVLTVSDAEGQVQASFDAEILVRSSKGKTKAESQGFSWELNAQKPKVVKFFGTESSGIVKAS